VFFLCSYVFLNRCDELKGGFVMMDVMMVGCDDSW
jgi:hypothetical protein